MSERICSVEGCGKKHRALGLCHTHYCGQYRAKNPEKIKAESAAYRAKNPEKLKADRAAYYAKNPETTRRGVLKKYDLTPEQYAAALEMQGGLCAIGQHRESTADNRSRKIKNLAVDHDHVTGENRGLLCSACNRGLGYFKDDPVLLRAAAEYLEIHAALKAK